MLQRDHRALVAAFWFFAILAALFIVDKPTLEAAVFFLFVLIMGKRYLFDKKRSSNGSVDDLEPTKSPSKITKTDWLVIAICSLIAPYVLILLMPSLDQPAKWFIFVLCSFFGLFLSITFLIGARYSAAQNSDASSRTENEPQP
jgi:hypothetical protein